MQCLARNRAMQRLAQKFSAELQFGPDEVTGTLVAASPARAWLMGFFAPFKVAMPRALSD
jgi:hypothetical protein